MEQVRRSGHSRLVYDKAKRTIEPQWKRDWERHKGALSSALDKVKAKLDRIHPTNWKDESQVSLKLTMAELRAIRTFALQHHNE